MADVAEAEARCEAHLRQSAENSAKPTVSGVSQPARASLASDSALAPMTLLEFAHECKEQQALPPFARRHVLLHHAQSIRHLALIELSGVLYHQLPMQEEELIQYLLVVLLILQIVLM